MQHHLGPEAACALHLDAGREQRHHDHRLHAQPLRVVGHALGMVARRHGHHALDGGLGRGQLRQLVAGPAFLERSRVLQVLELEKHLRSGDL